VRHVLALIEVDEGLREWKVDGAYRIVLHQVR
jgi:hypothetical protein